VSIPPLPRINWCPNCGAFPKVSRCSIFQGNAMRLECSCGVAGPYVSAGEWQHQRAYAAWGTVFGQPERPAPPVTGSGVRAVP
jgi:hypothetical protein